MSNIPSQYTSSLLATSCNMPNALSQYTLSSQATSCNMPNVPSQYTLSSPTTSHDISTWNSNNKSQKYYYQHREKISTNSYNKTANTNSEELNFSDEESLNEVNTPEPFNKETITNLKIVSSMDFVSQEFKILNKKTRKYFDNFRHTFNKDMAALAKDLLVKNSKYLDASDFSEFKKSSSSLKSLENFIAESLKIHIEYLIE
ncbi:1314_t:CDS:2, partial [Gigaspora margarita]